MNRKEHGAFYTSKQLVGKVISLLIMDKLRGQLKSMSKKDAIDKIKSIRVLEPSCGDGSFINGVLTAFKSVELELGLGDAFKQSQIYAIEVMPCAADKLKQSYPGINIHVGSAIGLPWDDVMPYCNELEYFIIGNPPFIGSGRRTKEQSAEQEALMKPLGIKSFKSLDYVCNWFVSAHEYCKGRDNCRFAFVSTNSISQGSHVPSLWPFMLSSGMEIGFAIKSFKWIASGENKAGVSCVVIGMRNICNEDKILMEGHHDS